LTILMEHPEVVQSAVLQAANSFVSPYLREREPAIFDPARVEQEAPEWKQEMIELHGPTHGEDYWRALLQLTLTETISQPNYSPAALNQVQQPVLVIQGQEDRVNAPDQHAQIIAAHLPYAELWSPAGVGHNVHLEALLEWIRRVEDFLDRRGEQANEALYRLRRDRYADKRSPIFQVHAQSIAGEPGKLELMGEVLYADQRQAALEAARTAQAGKLISVENVKVLLDERTPWALVNRPVDDLRLEPRSTTERVSQALLGEIVRVLRTGREWSQVLLERHHYLGWIHTNALHLCSREEAAAYQAACRVRVLAELLPAWSEEREGARREAGKLPFGVRLPVEEQKDGKTQVRLPDGRLWWAESLGLLPLERSPTPNTAGIAFTLNLMRRFTGVPYMWGGRTPFGFDCAGFTGTFWDFLGLNLPRDADQQYQAGQPVDSRPEPGDLLFFSRKTQEPVDERQEGRFASITHVAVSLGGEEMIHANATAWGVSTHSMNPSSPRYRAWLQEHLIGIRRFR
jgi:cell wall-associated NlpC family hydrolase